jgi:hypothetical protein
MDITDFTKQQGQFLKAENVEKSSTKTFTITEEAQTVHNEKYDTDRLHILGQLDKEDYTFDCSKTNARTIAEDLGVDTKQWIGCQLVLETYKTKTSEGKMVAAINIASVKKVA